MARSDRACSTIPEIAPASRSSAARHGCSRPSPLSTVAASGSSGSRTTIQRSPLAVTSPAAASFSRRLAIQGCSSRGRRPPSTRASTSSTSCSAKARCDLVGGRGREALEEEVGILGIRPIRRQQPPRVGVGDDLVGTDVDAGFAEARPADEAGKFDVGGRIELAEAA